MQLDKKVISETSMAGKGGGEKAFAAALVDFKRVSACLFDFVNESTQEKIELKKQKNLQWFDGWKYHDLSSEDRLITMLFVLHDGDKVSSIYSMPLGTMIDTLLADAEYNEAGWTSEVLQMLHTLKGVAHKVQSKLPLKVKYFVEKHQDVVTLEYSAS